MPMELVCSQPSDDARHTGHRDKQCAYLCAWFMRRFTCWLAEYLEDYFELSEDE